MFVSAAVADIRRFIQPGTVLWNKIRTVGVAFFTEGTKLFPGGAAGRAQGGVRTPHAVKAGIIAAFIAASLFKNDMISYLPGNRSTVFADSESNQFKEALLGKHMRDSNSVIQR